MKTLLVAVAVLIGGLTSTAPVRADVAQETLAETLYQSAVDHIREGNYVAACPKLAESHKADPAGGTVLLLAICYEKVGKTASAWIKFKEALAMARADRRTDREERAREHLAALEPRLSKVTVVIPDEVRELPGFSITMDGIEVPPLSDSWTMPVDPGEHVFEARATAKVAWSTTVTVEMEDGQHETVEVPMLENATPAPPPDVEKPPLPPPPAQQRDSLPRNPRRTIGVVVGGAGLATLGIASYFGFRALSEKQKAEDRCPSSPCDDPRGVEASDRALDHANRTNVLLAVGGAAVGTGVVLILTAPRRQRTQLSFTATPTGANLFAGTTFF